MRRFALSSLAFTAGLWALDADIARAEEPGEEAPDGPSLDLWGFAVRPIVEARIRGEYRRNPLVDGLYGESAVLSAAAPTSARVPYQDQVALWERVRLGLDVSRGPVTVRASLEDVRGFGYPDTRLAGQPELPITDLHEGYIDLHTDDRDFAFRIGRQRVRVGDGHLVGTSDFAARSTRLDALRFDARFGDLDLVALAALLRFPGEVDEPEIGSTEENPELRPGAQLYVLDGTYHVAPFFAAELTALARIVREPFVDHLTPSDTFTGAARVFGDHRGIAYSVTGAIQGGRVARAGEGVEAADHLAGAVVGRVTWETALPWRLTFGAEGAYATGTPETTEGTGATVGVFDPILPDSTHLSEASGWFAWSNVIEGGIDVGIHPIPEFRSKLGYRAVGLADPAGPWRTGALYAFGRARANDDQLLGHVLVAELAGRPIEELEISGHYGLLVLGGGAENIFLATRPGLSENFLPTFAEVFTVDASFAL